MGRPAVVVRSEVTRVALEVIDAEGLDALSIGRIGRELGVKGPTLYHHFTDKAEILREVAKDVIGDLELSTVPTDSWQDWLVEVSMRLYRRVLAHPNATAILLQFLPDVAAVPGFGRAARVLSAHGIDPSLQVLLMEGTQKMIWGWALQRAAAVRERGAAVTSEEIAERWPELAAAMHENRWNDEELVETSLRAFMNGVFVDAS